MIKPNPFSTLNPPQLSYDRQVYVERAHRLRSAALSSLVRDIARWVGGSPR